MSVKNVKIVSCHQPNFIPWFPFFEKMNLSDVFIVLHRVQFEKNGFQNRFNIGDKWITNPVERGNVPIKEKRYTNGEDLYTLNMDWIGAIKKTLDIKTPIYVQSPDGKLGQSASEMLAEQVWTCGGTHYLTNPKAFDKYLDKKVFEKKGIEFISFKHQNPSSAFEMISILGIEKCRMILRRQRRKFDSLFR